MNLNIFDYEKLEKRGAETLIEKIWLRYHRPMNTFIGIKLRVTNPVLLSQEEVVQLMSDLAELELLRSQK